MVRRGAPVLRDDTGSSLRALTAQTRRSGRLCSVMTLRRASGSGRRVRVGGAGAAKHDPLVTWPVRARGPSCRSSFAPRRTSSQVRTGGGVHAVPREIGQGRTGIKPASVFASINPLIPGLRISSGFNLREA